MATGDHKTTPKTYALETDPTGPFRMRFSKKHAYTLVPLLMAEAETEDRSFPGIIEQIILKHYGIK